MHVGKAGRRPGLTIIELLVVIAIITLLMALLLPGLTAAQRAASRTRCFSNLSAIGKAIKQYMTDYGKRFPFADDWNQDAVPPAGVPPAGAVYNIRYTFVERVRYMDAPDVFHCPSDRGIDIGPNNPDDTFVGYGTSYGYSRRLGMNDGAGDTVVDNSFPNAPLSLIDVIAPSRQPLAWDALEWHNKSTNIQDSTSREPLAVLMADGHLQQPNYSDWFAVYRTVVRN